MRPWRSLSLQYAIRLTSRQFSSSPSWHNTSKTKLAVRDSKAYSKTLLLPKTAFPLRNDPSQDEAIQSRTCEELYKWQWENAKGPLFVFHDGPPYANGDLHLGHALNKILKDIINRYNVIIGKRVHYIPGWDCHGLPIENKVLKKLGKDVHELSPLAIREEAETYAKSEVQNQLQQFRQLGIMAGWTPQSTYRTLDHDYEIRQLRVFQQMVKNGLIYRHYRPVYFSPSSRSALAEAELEYVDDHISHSVYVTFDLDLSHQSRVSPALQTLVRAHPRVQLLVWTTTPWTLTANMAIAVNPEMLYSIFGVKDDPTAGITIVATERKEALQAILHDTGFTELLGEIQGSDLTGAAYTPIFSYLHSESSSPAAPSAPYRILPSSHVTPLSGTGLVHCAPAHGQEDYHLFHSLNLIPTSASSAHSLICHVDHIGCFSDDVCDVLGANVGAGLKGKEVLGDGSKKVVEVLKNIGRLIKVERVKHRYPYDWKTGKPVIVTATSQWFANLDAIKENAIGALSSVKFYPPHSYRRLESFIQMRSEWCISRQRVWGVPIPALYHLPTNRAILDDESLTHILDILQRKGVKYWWDGPIEEFIPPSLKAEFDDSSSAAEWGKGTDTMDVWFDSGTSWAMLESLHGSLNQNQNSRGREVKRGFLADVCLEGSDQHRGWFQSQLLTAVGSKSSSDEEGGVSPYGTLITHGMVLDQEGKKMSKSLGNIVSPKTIIYGGKNKKEPAYGVEILRLWAASVEPWNDMRIGPAVLGQCVEDYRKIRNTTRFILSNLGDRRISEDEFREASRSFRTIEKYVLHELCVLEKAALKAYAEYNFPQVVDSLTHFSNVTLSSFYFTTVKDTLYADAKDGALRLATLAVFQKILDTMVPIIAPILPHMAEEIHQTLRGEGEPVTSVFTRTWTPTEDSWHTSRVDDMRTLLTFRRGVLAALEKARQDKRIGHSLEADVRLVFSLEATPASTALHGVLFEDAGFAEQLFNVSRVYDQQGGNEIAPAWQYTSVVRIPDTEHDVTVVVEPAAGEKCPRCWMHIREPEETLCRRCSDVIGE